MKRANNDEKWTLNLNKKKTSFCVNIHTDKLKNLNDLVDKYYFSSRSILIEYCIDKALPIILEECKRLDRTRNELNELDLSELLEFLKKHGFVIKHGVQPSNKIPLGNIYFNSNNEKILLKASK